MAVVGMLIGAAFGRLWLSMAAEGLHGWRAAIEATGWVVLGIFAVAAVFVAMRVYRAPPDPGGDRPLRGWAAWFGVAVVAEVALIGAGAGLLSGKFGHPAWVPVWILFVVGAHFSAFALIFRIGAFHMLAGVMCAAALVSALAAGVVGAAPLWSVLPGLAGAAAVSSARLARRPRRSPASR